MDSTQAPVTYLYQLVDEYKKEMNITTVQWYADSSARVNFWHWVELKNDLKPVIISFSDDRAEETREILSEMMRSAYE